MIASVLCSSLFVAGPASFINPSSSFAAENDTGYTIVNSSSTANTHNFSLVNSNNKVDVYMVETDESITIKTITNGEEHIIIYNKSDGSATLNGEKMNLKVSEPEFVIDESLSLSDDSRIMRTTFLKSSTLFTSFLYSYYISSDVYKSSDL